MKEKIPINWTKKLPKKEPINLYSKRSVYLSIFPSIQCILILFKLNYEAKLKIDFSFAPLRQFSWREIVSLEGLSLDKKESSFIRVFSYFLVRLLYIFLRKNVLERLINKSSSLSNNSMSKKKLKLNQNPIDMEIMNFFPSFPSFCSVKMGCGTVRFGVFFIIDILACSSKG